ncbi:hypothetical protein BP5796_12269 [Coleophoma crateriformis]|uniref:Zn(2)-C6 fungal-type domain-containing protein n=1 Tax=Coleophoma crateriformis TaxID=565419 RepID=A0A3D8Q965_9HELO|nr:hypothetical protein BP5796_12269 [Coleophoma crateriformis]
MPDRVPAPFTTVFRASETHKVKRNRPTVSCTACQKRKLRCDRRRPCGACETRGHQAACHFDPSGHDGDGGNNRQEVLSRLSKLEEMVKGFADSSHRDRSIPARDELADGTAAMPHVSDAEDTTVYYGSTSWAALVEGIQGIQSVLEAKPPQPFQDSDIVFGDLAPVSINDIDNCLPPRRETDRLISAFFNSKFVALPFLHTHHFRRRYEAFLGSPSSTNLLWVSILFSVLSIGAIICRTKDPSVASPTSMLVAEPQVYMAMAARCLVSGQYTQAKVHSVEAILAYAHSRNVLRKDSDPILWSLYGVAVRVAQRRGYHRNPQIARLKLTPFEAEIRRRVWFTIRSYDLFFSSQHGMPPMVHEGDCDVEIPTNLTDDDFDEDCIELPPARPSTDPIPILAYIYKAKVLPTLHRINRRALGVRPSTAELAMELSEALDEWYKSIPPCLAYRPIKTTAFTDANHTIMHRIMLELIYLRSRGFLYCPYLISTKGWCRERAQSMDLCREAALRIIDIHLQVDEETQPGGRLYEDRYMISSLTLNDFLNAAMFICVDLTETEDVSSHEREARINILRKSYHLWLKRCDESSDAQFACRVLQAILKRIECSYQTLTPVDDPLPRHRASSDSTSFEAPKETFLVNGNPGDEFLFAEQCMDFENFPSFDALFTGMEPYSWNSVTQLRQDEWAEIPFITDGQA